MTQFARELTEEGEFKRQKDAFRDWITEGGASKYAAEPGRYHLYVSLACPWAHRTIIVRKLKGLENLVGLTVVDPIRDDRGWRFTYEPDPLHGWDFLSEAYLQTMPDYEGRFTVPVLWDRRTNHIVNNSEDDIMRMFNSAFNPFIEDPEKRALDLYPEPLRPTIDQLYPVIYETVNDGVYKAGFATSQACYERHVYPLFETLDRIETLLKRQRFLAGDEITELDWKLFVTLIRFDAVYYSHFKCNLRRIVDYPNLFAYVCDLYQQPGVAETVNFDHIKRHYYRTHPDINPNGIVPVGPDQSFDLPHYREHLS